MINILVYKSILKSLYNAIKIIFIAFLFISLPGFSSNKIKNFMPDIDGWNLKNHELYKGKLLYNYIDGAATKYIDNGFQKLEVFQYSGPNEELIITEVYEFGNSNRASNLYMSEMPENYEKFDISDQGYIIDLTFLNFKKDKYYIKLYSYNNEKDILEVIKNIALGISSKL